MSSDYEVATGFWQNHSNNGWLAASLTLDVRSGSLLVAAIATFITIVGSRFWSILSFAIHQVRATSADRDGVHHQHQVIYKNSTQLGTVWLLTQVVWAWRNNASRNFIRYFAFALPPLLCFAGFTAASILSSRVAAPTYATSEVRVKPRNCGFIEFIPPSSSDYDIQFGTAYYSGWATGKAREATNYARTCYGATQANCRAFPAQELPYKTNTSAVCPFKGDRCILGQQGAFELATDWMDSHEHLGINVQPKDRIRFRKLATCSVVNVEDLISAAFSAGTDLYDYSLGPRGTADDGVGMTNSTYQSRESSRFDTTPYSIAADKAVVLDPYQSRGWQPIDDFNRTNADVSVFFLNSNGVRYPKRVLDPLYRATIEVNVAIPTGSLTYYRADNLTTILGCTDQFQIQNPNTNIATELTSSVKAQLQSLQIGLNNAQLMAVTRLGLTGYESLMFNSVSGLSAAALHAPDVAYQTLSAGLPDDQWRAEVQGWFNASLATLQARVVAFAAKDMAGTEKFAKLNLPSGYPELLDMCQNQIVKNVGQYQSFSVLGIGIIFAVGVFVILLSWILEPVVGWTQRRFSRRGSSEGSLKGEQWLLASALQLQRLAFQKAGFGGQWAKCDGEVPVSLYNERWSTTTGGEHEYVNVRPKN